LEYTWIEIIGGISLSNKGLYLNKDYFRDIKCPIEAGYVKCWNCGKQSSKKKGMQKCRCCGDDIFPYFEKGDIIIFQGEEAIFQQYNGRDITHRKSGFVLFHEEYVKINMKNTKLK
jgi:hypothetical protein